MKYTDILLRYGEIFLKGKNKGAFEKQLIQNIKKITKVAKIKNIRGRLITDYFENHLLLKNVFGLISYSPSIKVERDVEEIKKASLNLLNCEEGIKSFKIVTKRADKQFPIKSPEMNVLVGKFIEDNSSLVFNLNDPDKILKIEINQTGVYIFTETIQCYGGLPVGGEGEVLLLIENDASILAGLLFMKRGSLIIPVSLSGGEDISLLNKFNSVKFQIKKIKTLNELEKLSKERCIGALIIGENFSSYKERKTTLTTLRPLIAYTDNEIKTKLTTFT